MRYEIICGIGKDKNGLPVTNVEDKLNNVRKYAAGAFGGYTMVRGAGGWVNDDKLIEEDVIVIILYSNGHSANYKQARDVAELAKTVFEQTSVVLSEVVNAIEYV